MNLVFYDRRTAPAITPTEALLTIERKGNFSLSIGAVAGLNLKPERPVVLAQDADTNTWYLLLEPHTGLQPFVLRPRDKDNNRALMFCSLPQARAYYEAHNLGELKSVRCCVELTPVAADGLKLYPLRPQHSTKTPAPVAPVITSASPAEETPAVVQVEELAPVVATEPVVPATELVADSKPTSKYTAEMDARLMDMANSPSDLAREWNISAAALHTRRAQLKKKAGELPAPVAVPVAPAVPTLIYTPATQESGEPVKKTFGLQARAEELGSYWMERDINRATPGELAEILNLMRHVPASKRGIEMTLVLDRAEVEQTHRNTAAGKGANRG